MPIPGTKGGRCRPPVSLLSLLTLLALAVGCGDDVGGEVASNNAADAATSPTDLGPGGDDTFEPLDTATADSGADDAGTTDTGSSPQQDVGGKDTALDCPGGPGCGCTEHSDCDLGVCITVGLTKQCADKCVDTCKAGFKCAAVNTGGTDTATICVPSWDRLCAPCGKGDDCQTLGFDDNACIDRGAAGSFCGVVCADDKGCPSGHACQDAKDVAGNTVKQCVPVDDKGALATCACNEWASANAASTKCAVQHKGENGAIIASCPGTRQCGSEGLSACLGADPSGEACNGKDDDWRADLQAGRQLWAVRGRGGSQQSRAVRRQGRHLRR